jgi:hypothetical protein
MDWFAHSFHLHEHISKQNQIDNKSKYEKKEEKSQGDKCINGLIGNIMN